MSRPDTAALLAALLCVAALGLAAATVATPVDSDAFSRNFDDPAVEYRTPFDIDLDASSDWTESDTDRTGHWTFTTRCVPFLLTPTFYAGILIAFVGLFAGVRRRLASEYAFAVVAFLLPIILFAHATLTENCIPAETTVDFGLPEGTVVNETVSEATRTVSPETGTPLLGLAVAGAFVLLVVAALATTVRMRSDGEPARAVTEPEPAHDLAGVASVAGDAADRIEGGDADPGNAVYRAWTDMTDHLDVPNAHTASPAAFRATALDAGMAPRHVDTLTDLFREVRYGGAEPTPDREQRAIDALRAIEDAYGGDR